MSDAPDAAAEPKRAPPSPGLLRNALKLAKHAGGGIEAGLELGLAEARLTRASIPHAITWLCVSLVFGGSLLACAWVGLLMLLAERTGSVGIALAWLAGFSVLALAGAVLMLMRCIAWMTFPESRRRLARWIGGADGHESR